ncbi:MAG: hypothetical protein WC866_02940 [Patescibacteria group bacterium]
MQKHGSFHLLTLILFLGGCTADTSNDDSSTDTPTVSVDGRGNRLGNLAIAVDDDGTASEVILNIDSGSDNLHVVLRDGKGATALSAEKRAGLIVVEPFRAVASETLSALDVYVNGEIFGVLDVYVQEDLPSVPDHYVHLIQTQGEGYFIIDMMGLSNAMRTSQTPSEGSEGTVTQALSCGNGTSGPGIADFWSGSPGSGGQGFSFMPEWTNTLFWALNGELTADGIYRSSWGCGTALKIPNNCSVYVKQDASLQNCCGFPWFQPSWINTYSDSYFPDCPL